MIIAYMGHCVRQSLFSIRNRSCVLPVVFALLMTLASPLMAATYYVDFQGGDDQADGLTPQTAWKHSPGDRNATGNPGSAELQPGDTIVFKGGVPYVGEIQLSVSGSEDNPITLDGNTTGTFGQGRAILDGARMITDWQHCQSAEQVQGNPQWQEIVYADLDVDLSSNFEHGRFVAHRDAGEAQHGVLQDNVVLNHFGMHSSGLNFYEGCADILFEGNYVHNTVAINRSAQRLVFRNNVIDGLGRSAVAVAMWTSGRVGGREIKDIHFFHNTFVNLNPGTSWATGILGQRSGSPSPPQGLIIRHNILHSLVEDIAGEIDNNLYTRAVEQRFMGPGCLVVTDPEVLFRNSTRGDYRRKPGGPAMDAGASIPPPEGLNR